MKFTINALIPLLTLLVYLLLNWNVIKNKFFILISASIGAFLWFVGQLTLTDNDSWLIWLGFCIFIFVVIVDSGIRFKKALRDKNV